MQAEMLVERQSAVFRTGPGDRDCRARCVIGFVAVGNDDVQAVGRAAQQHDNEPLLPGIAGSSPGAAAQREQRCSRRQSEKIAPAHRHLYRRMKSGLPSIKAACNSAGAFATAARVLPLRPEPSVARSDAAPTGSAPSALGSFPPASAVAKLTRSRLASGLSHAASLSR